MRVVLLEILVLVHLLCLLTQPQACHTAQVTPWQRWQRAPVLHSGEVQDEGHTGDEDQVEEAHGGEEVRNLSQVGTAQEHLKQNLER